MSKRRMAEFKFNDIHRFLQILIGEDLHAERVFSLAGETLGVMTSASLAIHVIGKGLAQARGKWMKTCRQASRPFAFESGYRRLGPLLVPGTE
ncbi:MAG: hypothetical protein QNJ82_14580 [Gammaproteobacteria bacterium]|nr:hypothetical protein [Gammaproteobacteria bacterium]